MALLQFHQLSKSYGAKTLLDQASASVDAGSHIAVIGPNGAGKTTLFKLILGIEEPDAGQVIKTRGLRIGYLPQEAKVESTDTLIGFMTQGATLAEWDVRKLAAGLGLAEDRMEQPLQSFSGGYRMRAALVKLLATEPELLLLDEPTNYLDLETLLVLEQFLVGFKGTFLLISHDREFLRKVCDHTLEVEGGDLTQYPGTIDDYFEQKQLLEEQLHAKALSQAAKRAEILDFVARFGAKATKASQAQSRLKQLDRMEKIEIKKSRARVGLKIPAPDPVGKEAIRAQGLKLGYGDRVILNNVDLSVARGDRVAIVGYNGAGKSTLLKALGGALEPLAGQIHYGVRVQVGLYAQHVAEALDGERTVLESLSQAAPKDAQSQVILDLAGSLLFSGDAVKKPVRVLSGGEKSRVALGQVLLSRASVLLLDEPTNHLDFDTVEALAVGLEEHPGTVLVVSHDRAFMSRIATKIIEVTAGGARVYPGTYDEYVWSVQKGAYAEQNSTRASSTRSNSTTQPVEAEKSSHELRKEKQSEQRTLTRKLEKIEKDLAALDLKRRDYHEALSGNPGSWTPQLGAEIAENQGKIDSLEAEWLELQEKLSAFK